jgi:PAS domain S-box-containing protein
MSDAVKHHTRAGLTDAVTAARSEAFNSYESELAAIYAHAPVGLTLIDTEMHYLRINEALAEINGIPAADHIGRTVAEIVPAREVMRQMIEAGETIGPIELEGETPSQPGVRRIWLQHWSPVRNYEGTIIAASISALEVTDRVNVARASEAAERDLRRVIDSVLPFVGRLTPDGILTEANAPAVLASGLAKSDLVGKHFWDCYWWNFDPDVQARLRQSIERAATGETVRYDTQVRVVGNHRISIDFQLIPNVDENGRVFEIIPSGVDITDRLEAQDRLEWSIRRMKAEEKHRKLLLGELKHRVKNTLATIQAISRQTANAFSDPKSFSESFNGRLRAIAAAHDLITSSSTARVELKALLEAQVAPYAGDHAGRLELVGPDVTLSGDHANDLGLVLHELATNAAKYGALGVDDGKVHVSWKEQGDALEITWVESGGPPVSQPADRGFGTRLIETALSHSGAGETRIEYRPDGLFARLVVPAGPQ